MQMLKKTACKCCQLRVLGIEFGRAGAALPAPSPPRCASQAYYSLWTTSNHNLIITERYTTTSISRSRDDGQQKLFKRALGRGCDVIELLAGASAVRCAQMA